MTQKPSENLQAFLYTLVRDDVVPGRVEALVQDQERHPGPYTFSNPHLAAYALDLSWRLLREPPESELLGKLVALINEAIDAHEATNTQERSKRVEAEARRSHWLYELHTTLKVVGLRATKRSEDEP